jgi:hypothetical protein
MGSRAVSNHWDLYQSRTGWEAVSARLDVALAEALASIDATVAGGGSVTEAARDAFQVVLNLMEAENNAPFGAADSEPRGYLAGRIRTHVRTKYRPEFRNDRWGGVA